MRLDEAARCVVCDKVTFLITSVRLVSPSTGGPMDVAVYECQNVLCLNKGWRFVVQSDLNGEVVQRASGERGRDKEFPKKPQSAYSEGRIKLEEALGREYDRNVE